MDSSASRGSTSFPHGVKRRADDELRDDQRLTRRLNLLRLEHNGGYHESASSPGNIPRRSDNLNSAGGDSMQLDDTKTKVYIHNLEEEIAEIEDEDKLVFLPDIEKKLGKIPHYLLTGDLRPTAENQMVLYGVPASLSVPEEKDNVRKAIIESRERAREKQLSDDEAANTAIDPARTRIGQFEGMGYRVGSRQPEPDEDEDAMDLG